MSSCSAGVCRASRGLRELPSGSAIVNLEVTTLVDEVSVSVPVVVEAATVDCARR